MLTFILVVVLGGGVGLVVVSLAESEKPATDAGQNGRADPPDAGPGPGAEPEPDTVPEPEPEPEPEPVPDPEPVVASGPPPERRFAPLVPPTPGPSGPSGPAAGPERRRSAGSVPAGFVAVEGTYAEVARVPIWRRLLAVIGILAIAVVGGVVIAAVLAAVVGAAAELLGNTIG